MNTQKLFQDAKYAKLFLTASLLDTICRNLAVFAFYLIGRIGPPIVAMLDGDHFGHLATLITFIFQHQKFYLLIAMHNRPRRISLFHKQDIVNSQNILPVVLHYCILSGSAEIPAACVADGRHVLAHCTTADWKWPK